MASSPAAAKIGSPARTPSKDDLDLTKRRARLRSPFVSSDDEEETEVYADQPAESRFSVLESLDLEPSVPYSLAYIRAQMAEYAAEMERSLHVPFADKLKHSLPLESLEARLQDTYTSLSQWARGLLGSRSYAWLEQLPTRQSLSTKVRGLTNDWERRASTFHPSLFPGGSASYTAWATRMPAHVPEEVQNALMFLRAKVHDITVRPLLDTSSALAQEAQAWSEHMLPSDLLQRFEAKLASAKTSSIKAGEQIVHAVHEVEDALYHAALQLANNGLNLIHYHSLPELWRNNDYIITGYRFIPMKNWRTLLYSMFQVHNETGNIHSHVGGLVLVVALYWSTGVLDQHTTAMDRWIQTIYLLAAAKCLLCSVSWHVMAGCSDLKWFNAFACIDYTGISWLVAASLETLVYNGFYCQLDLIIVYTMGVLALGMAMAIVPWAPWFNDLRYRTARISLFILMAFMGIVPFVHGAILHGWGPMWKFYSPVMPSVASYLTGVIVYAFRFPECLAPGRFDIWGHSHQLWHLAIVLAIYLHYRAILIFHENRFDYSCALSPSHSSLHQYLSSTYTVVSEQASSWVGRIAASFVSYM